MATVYELPRENMKYQMVPDNFEREPLCTAFIAALANSFKRQHDPSLVPDQVYYLIQDFVALANPGCSLKSTEDTAQEMALIYKRMPS
jgi:hypothetical protein